MNVIQRPKPREFCATMREYIIDTDSTITFSVRYGGKTVLEEEYSPDADFKVRTRGLGKFCELALWGVWCAGENTAQTDAAGDFTFLINGVEDMTCFVMFSRLVTRKDAEAPGCLSEVNRKVTYPGAKEYVSGFPVDASGKKGMNVTAYWDDGTEENRFVAAGSYDDGVYTFDTSPDVVSSLFEKPDILQYKVEVSGGSLLFVIDRTRYAEAWCFRFKNVYDMPETLTATGGLKMAGNNENRNESISGMKFLCAEDNELNAEILEQLLKYEGAECVICENGKEVVETFKQSKPGEYDMILMDIQMPIMNGYEATLKIRLFDQDIPIIAMTANAFSDDIQHSLSVGMDAHISKPVDMQVLKRVVQNIKSGGGGVPQTDITENKL